MYCRPCGQDVETTFKVPMGHATGLRICASCLSAVKRGDLGLSWKDRGLYQQDGRVQAYGKIAGKEGAWEC